MNRKIALAAAVAAVALLTVSGLLVYAQFSSLQAQIADLRAQNGELQNQNSVLEAQVGELQLQNREQQDRLKDFTQELAKTRPLLVEITAFAWLGDFNPIGGLTISHTVNVTVQNNDAIPVYGLTLTVRLQNKDSGALIGSEGQTRIDRIGTGESQVIGGYALTTLTIDGSSPLNNGECFVRLSAGEIILDEWTASIG